MKAALYIRVSTIDQKTLNQELLLTEYCRRADITLSKVYKDEGVSGSKTSRPQLDLMLQDMRMGHFDTVIVWKLDRLGRSLQHLLQLLSEFQNQKIRLICTDMNFDTDTPQGKFFFSIVGGFAELEREITRERIMAGIERARRENKHLGRPPGKKDSKPRRKSGYYQQWLEKKMRT